MKREQREQLDTLRARALAHGHQPWEVANVEAAALREARIQRARLGEKEATLVRSGQRHFRPASTQFTRRHSLSHQGQ